MTGKFVVVEGLDATGKSKLAPRLADRLEAVHLKCPPRLEAPGQPVMDLRSHFDRRPHLQRRAYYRAANLVASEQVLCALGSSHVVMDRYWPSTFAYSALDRGFDARNDCMPRYPPELHEPDALILLTVTEEVRAQRIANRRESLGREEQALEVDAAGREAVLQRYREFSPIEIDTSHKNPAAVLQAALDVLHEFEIIPNAQPVQHP